MGGKLAKCSKIIYLIYSDSRNEVFFRLSNDTPRDLRNISTVRHRKKISRTGYTIRFSDGKVPYSFPFSAHSVHNEPPPRPVEFATSKLLFQQLIMLAESESNERVFTIPRQTFRQKVPVKHSWTVKLKARDQFGDEEDHEWLFQTRDWPRQNMFFLKFDGIIKKNYEIKYEKFSCKVQIFDDSGAKIKSIKQNDRRLQPNINSFAFLDICNFAYDGDIFPLSVDFSFTIGSRDQNKSRSFDREKMMLDEGILTDMVIKTKERELPCHKFVLAVESEYFRTMFQTEMKEKETNVVEWTGVFEAPVVLDLLHFLYTLEKPPNLKDNHFELIDAAHLCMLPKLKNICAESIGDVIQVDNAARVLQTAELFGLENLKKSAIKFLFVSSNWKLVVATEFYQKLDPMFYKTMLESVLSEVDKNFIDKK